MKNYRWKGIDVYGKEITGFLSAANSQELTDILLQQKIAIFDFKETKDKFIFFGKKIHDKDNANFFEQLYVLISSGLLLLESLNIILNQTKNKKFKIIVSYVIENIKNGVSFSESLKKYLDIFTLSEITIVAAGENSGHLDFSLTVLSNNLNKKIELIKKNSKCCIVANNYISFFVIFGFWNFYFCLATI